MKTVVSLTMLLLLVAASSAQSKSIKTGHHNTAKSHKPTKQGIAYFIDFNFETFGAVTAENINTSGDKIVLYPDDITTLRGILTRYQQTGLGDFDKSKVRLRLQDEKRNVIALVDQQGVTIQNSKQHTLTPFAFVQLYHYMTYLMNRNN